MKHFIFFFSACFLYVILSGCESVKQNHYYQINTRICALMNFKQGGYWLMQDSATSEIHKFYISYADTGSQYESEGYNYFGELNTHVIESYGSDTLMIMNVVALAYAWTELYFNDNKTSYMYRLSPIVTDPFYDGSNSTNPDDNITGEFLPQLNLNGHTYKDVFHYTYKSYAYPKEDQVYYNRDNGFIKIVLNNVSKHRTLTQTNSYIERRY